MTVTCYTAAEKQSHTTGTQQYTTHIGIASLCEAKLIIITSTSVYRNYTHSLTHCVITYL